MDATLSQPKAYNQLLSRLRHDHPDIVFCPGEVFMWSPRESTVYYPTADKMNTKFCYSLLHEAGHALLKHDKFSSDINLVQIERAAWDKAVELAGKYELDIPDAHIELCIGTYRDWLHARAMCPNCHQCGLQTSKRAYKCIFCQREWQVNESRLCRVTRTKLKTT
jgi:ribosomal protein RSM22 (predicted rRNA methylase)